MVSNLIAIKIPPNEKTRILFTFCDHLACFFCICDFGFVTGLGKLNLSSSI